MIKEIKNYIKSVVKEASNISDSSIYFSISDTNQYDYPPWCKIITDKSTIKELWDKERKNDEEGKFKVITRKYSVVLPVFVGFCGEKEEEVDEWVHSFLEKVERYITINGQAVFLNPTAIEYSDNISIMSGYIGVIRIEVVYGIYTETQFDKISNIEEEVEYRR